MTCCIGIDLGTSGVRAIAIDEQRQVIAEATTDLPSPLRTPEGGSEQQPELWWQAVLRVLSEIPKQLNGEPVSALAVDGTSATLLLSDRQGRPLTPALMYNDARSRDVLDIIKQHAPPDNTVHSASSSLAKLLHLQRQIGKMDFLALHQADLINGRLSDRFGLSDENNCLKLGYDAINRRWPDWLDKLGLPPGCLPQVYQPGTPLFPVSDEVLCRTELKGKPMLVAGTTDSIAATLATGAERIGDAVTSLGSTLVLKILSDRPINAPEYGVYSHRLGDLWLAGGASNSGGAVCAHYFSREQMARLTVQLKPDHPTGLHYYPLLQPGERFPFNDPNLPPRLTPNADSDLHFFQGILEGIAEIEKAGYDLLARLGAPPPSRIFSTGGGASNEPWRLMRQNLLGVPVLRAMQTQAAYGAALLALGSTGS